MPSAEILIVFAITALLNVDVSISIPSLYLYVQQVAGAEHARQWYGVAACIDSFCGIFFFPLYGYLADRYSPKRVFLASFIIMGLGGVVYGIPGNLKCGKAGPYLIVLGRFLIGSTSGLRAVGNGFIASYSPPDKRTENLGIAQIIVRICLLLGPALNLVMVQLPRGMLFGVVRFDQYTWCGFSVTVLAIIYFIIVVLFFDPSVTERVDGRNRRPYPVGRREMCNHISKSRCWVNAHIAFINNVTGQCFTYFLPIFLTSRPYNYNQVKLSLVFCVFSGIGLPTAFLSAKLSHRWYERSLLFLGQAIIGIGNTGFLLIFGGCMEGGPADTRVQHGAGAEPMGASGSGSMATDGWELSSLLGGRSSRWVDDDWDWRVQPSSNTSSTPEHEAVRTGWSSGWGGGCHGCECSSQGYLWAIPRVPIWVVILIGGWWNMGGSIQVTGLQGLYAQLVGANGQGVYQAFFFMCNYTGRALGSFMVGPLAAVTGDSILWASCLANYSLLWLSFGYSFRHFHPVRITMLNGGPVSSLLLSHVHR